VESGKWKVEVGRGSSSSHTQVLQRPTNPILATRGAQNKARRVHRSSPAMLQRPTNPRLGSVPMLPTRSLVFLFCFFVTKGHKWLLSGGPSPMHFCSPTGGADFPPLHQKTPRAGADVEGIVPFYLLKATNGSKPPAWDRGCRVLAYWFCAHTGYEGAKYKVPPTGQPA